MRGSEIEYHVLVRAGWHPEGAPLNPHRKVATALELAPGWPTPARPRTGTLAPHVHDCAAGPSRVGPPTAARLPGVAAGRVVHRRRLQRHRVRGHRPERPQPDRRMACADRRRAAPRRRDGRPPERGRQPQPPLRRGGVRGHRAQRPRHLQRAAPGKGTVPARDPPIRDRRARRHRRRQRHHRPSAASEAGRCRVVPAAAQGESLERVDRAQRRRMERRRPALRVHRRAPPPPPPR